MSIKIENLTHVYMPKTPFETVALDNINLDLEEGKFYALIGHTGSGKSTLIQHLNGLLKPTSGKIYVDDMDITDKSTVMSEIRKKVGLVFQYPEYQLFEETIEKDIAFGPNNLGLSKEEVTFRVKRAMEMVGLEYEKYKDLSPFEISGGQKRRVAIAGVVAMEPKVLILDEPIAGLDPRGRDAILGQLKKLHEEYRHTVILVTHSMEDVAEIADEVIVMSGAKIMLQGTPREVFVQLDLLEEVGLGAPQITYLMRALKEKGLPVREDIFTVQEAKEEIKRMLVEGGGCHD
ncbi:MAG TPA: energy-coupling factor transporter ATPase [Clostridiaceae bacterium]|nr:energy-coupling factor transporter ATPase [Clostridiaceae bacterium]